MPTYSPSKQEWEAYMWCMRNKVRVSPGRIQKKLEWTVDISTDGATWKRSPKSYGKEEIWEQYYKICIWFENKYKK